MAAIVAMVLIALAGCAKSDPQPTAASSPSPSPVAVSSAPSPAPTPSPTRASLFLVKPVHLQIKGFWSWAYLDFKTGKIDGSSPVNALSDTASMTKAWIAADYLRRQAEQHKTPNATIMDELTRMIRDSDNTHAYEFHVANGNLSSIQREIKMCGLTDTKGHQNSWSLTQMSARDVARLAKCIADGRAAGPKWTPWLLNEMRNVRGAGRFGIIEALPADVAKTTAIKNGWLARDDGQWHIACMATGDGWSLAVMARYRSTLGKDYGAKTCREVTKQLLAD